MLWSDPVEVSGADKKDHGGICAALLEDFRVLVPTRVSVLCSLCSTGLRNEAGDKAGVVLLGGGTERWRLGWVRLSVAVVLGGGRGLSGGNRGAWGRERGGGTKEELLRRRVGGMVSVPGGGGLRVRF